MSTRDQELITGMAQQSREAFSTFFDHFSPRVFGIILSLLRNRTDAEDVLQETFLQAWNQAGRYDQSQSTPEGWIIMIARSRAIDRLRKNRRKSQILRDSNANLSSVLDRTIQQDDEGRVRVALNFLEEELRKPIQLSFFSGFTHTEIAQLLNLPLGTVKTRIRQGILKLRNELIPVTGGD
ncbi:MAG: sigma-70 family RNA polymerase sigma factor [Gemmataceae bacterium]